MIKITLNGKKMDTKEKAHLYIKRKLNTPEYYGKNLDALWDVLSSYNEPIIISLKNKDKLIENLGDYGESIIGVFQDAEKENDNISFEIIEKKLQIPHK